MGFACQLLQWQRRIVPLQSQRPALPLLEHTDSANSMSSSNSSAAGTPTPTERSHSLHRSALSLSLAPPLALPEDDSAAVAAATTGAASSSASASPSVNASASAAPASAGAGGGAHTARLPQGTGSAEVSGGPGVSGKVEALSGVGALSGRGIGEASARASPSAMGPLSEEALAARRQVYRMAPHSPYDATHLVPKASSRFGWASLDPRGAFLVQVRLSCPLRTFD